MTSDLFSTKDAIAENEYVSPPTSTTSPHDPFTLEEFYEVSSNALFVKKHNGKRVALQLPSAFLPDAFSLSKALSGAVDDCEFFVLGDTTHAECCVDEVLAQHMKGDVILHFGSACLSASTRRTPVRHTFGRKVLNPQNLSKSLDDLAKSGYSELFVTYDLCYHFLEQKMNETCRFVTDPYVIWPAVVKEVDSEETEQIEGEASSYSLRGFNFPTSPSHSTNPAFLYIGEDGREFESIVLNTHPTPVFRYDTSSETLISPSRAAKKILMRRFFLSEKVKDAERVGIVVATLATEQYLEIINRLKRKLLEAGKKPYVFSVGKLNPAKLANFTEIDVFVLVSCPLTALIDTSEYFQEIVCPFDVEIALGLREWTAEYTTAFVEILRDTVTGEDAVTVDETPRFSLIDRKMHHSPNDDTTCETGALVELGTGTLAVKKASAALLSRSWQGVEVKLGETAPAEIERGGGFE